MSAPGMVVPIRFRIPVGQAPAFRAEAAHALTVLGGRPGCLGAHLGRNVDDPELWTMTTLWQDTGSYRRAIGSYDVKLEATLVLSRALEEPSAYEVAVSVPTAMP